MPNSRDEFQINLPLIDSLSGCQKAVASLGWRVVKQSEKSLVCKEPLSFGFAWPVQVEIILNYKSSNSTRVTLNGSISGYGPLQSDHLKKQMALLRNRIQLASGTAATIRTCWNCHNEVPEGAGLCPKCGKEVVSGLPSTKLTQDRPRRSRRVNMVTFIIVGILNVAMFVVALTQKSWANLSFIWVAFGWIALWIGLIMLGVNLFRKKILRRPGIQLKRGGLLIVLGLVFSTMGYVVLAVSPPGGDTEMAKIVKAREGGKLSLPGGSTVSIPAGLLAHDARVSLSLQPSSRSQIPNKAITSVGPALVVSFEPRSAASSRLQEFVFFGARAWAATPGEIEVSLRLSGEEQRKLEGSIPFADVVHTDGTHQILGLDGQFDSTANVETVKVPLLRPEGVKEFTVSHAGLKPAVETTRLPTPGGKTWDGTRWVDGTSGSKPSSRTLVLVHGMLSSVEQAFPQRACIDDIARKGGYDQVVGFSYNWTQGLEDSGRQLATFLDQLRAAGITEVDIEAHSEGVPVSLSAYAKTSMPVRNMVLLGGPIMGTPAASRGAASQYHLMLPSLLPTTLLNWGQEDSLAMLQGRGDITLKQVLNGKFAEDLRPGSDTLAYIRGAVAQKMNRPEIGTKLIAVAGTDWTRSSDMTALGLILQGTNAFLNEKFDGIVGENSALALTPDGKESGLRVTRMRHPVSHTQLTCNPQVIQSVGKELNPRPAVTTPTPIATPAPTPTRVIPTPITPTPAPTPAGDTKPDLTVTAVSFSPSSGRAGQSLSVTFTIKNQGNTASGPFSNRISLATTRYGTNYSLGNFAMESLPAGASRTLTLVSNAIPSSVPQGSYWVTVFADGFQQIAESDENNNIGSSDTSRFTIATATPTPATDSSFSGIWKGSAWLGTTVTGASCRYEGDVTLSLTQTGDTLQGTITYNLFGDRSNSSVRCPATRVYGTANIRGTVTRAAVNFSFTTAAPFAGFTVNAKGIRIFSEIQGDFSGDAQGQFLVEKQ